MRYASFFTGAMGLDLGLEQAGWECVHANEHDPIACQTIRLNRPDLKLVEGDIRRILPSCVSESLRSSLDMVVGGPPCQAFSTAGKRLGLNDERGNVFLHFIELACAMHPKLIVIENVRGLLSAPLKHRPHAERGHGLEPLTSDEQPGGAFSRVLNLLCDAGYSVTHGLYNTADFGVPQKRQRVLIFASRVSVVPSLVPSHGSRVRSPSYLAREPWRTLSDAINGFIEGQEFLPLREKQRRFIHLLKPGQNWRDLPPDLQREAMGRAFDCTGGRTGFYRRLAWDEPSPTLVTSPTMPATLLAHPVEDRPLSVQEYARIQTFPDDWKFAGTTAQKYRQIGNAVPVEFGRQIGEHMKEFLQSRRILTPDSTQTEA